MLKLSSRNSQSLYTAVQSLYWLTYGLMFPFAAIYLQNRGFSNSGIGIVLGCSYAFSTLLQPMIASLFGKFHIQTENGMCSIYGIIILLSLLLLLIPLPALGIALLVVAVFSLTSALQPSVDTLARRWTNMGCTVDYGASRGFGSLLYAGMTAGMGLLLQYISPISVPLFYLATMVSSVVLLKRIHVPSVHWEETGYTSTLSWKSLLNRPLFLLFLAGISCVSFGHVLVDNFMLQIMQAIGGSSGNLGIAISIASLVEFPAMMLYGRLVKRFGARKLVVFSAWAWTLKNILILFARTPSAIYLAEIMQFFSYGLYIPASIDYICQIFPMQDNLKGQSFVGSAYTVGCVLATLLGGMLIDAAGIPATLLIVVCITLTGAFLFSFSVRSKV